MAHRKVTVTFPSLTGFPRDSVVNTFHFITPTPSDQPSTQAELDSISGALTDFYNGAHDASVFTGGVAGAKVIQVLAGVLISPTVTIRIYHCETEIALGASAQPIATYVVTFGALNAAAPVPEEVACCLSFRGVLDPDIPAARQRGRVFIGPMTTTAISVVANRTTVAPGTRATLAAAGRALVAWNTAGVDWVVWSHAALQAFPVTAGWVDDAFDTQRRRGPRAGVRLAW